MDSALRGLRTAPAGELKNFTGVMQVWEAPERPELHLMAGGSEPAALACDVIADLLRHQSGCRCDCTGDPTFGADVVRATDGTMSGLAALAHALHDRRRRCAPYPANHFHPVRGRHASARPREDIGSGADTCAIAQSGGNCRWRGCRAFTSMAAGMTEEGGRDRARKNDKIGPLAHGSINKTQEGN